MKTMGEALMDQGWREGFAEGRVRARAENVVRILVARGIAVDERVRTFILSCKDLSTLNQWIDQALSATSLADLSLSS